MYDFVFAELVQLKKGGCWFVKCVDDKCLFEIDIICIAYGFAF